MPLFVQLFSYLRGRISSICGDKKGGVGPLHASWTLAYFGNGGNSSRRRRRSIWLVTNCTGFFLKEISVIVSMAFAMTLLRSQVCLFSLSISLIAAEST